MSFDASKRDVAALERLSALMDGELDPSAVAQVCGHWGADDDARSSWHAYHLIGDVLRSDDLAEGSARDVEFMRTLRVRMSSEPVVLAPSQRPTPRPAERPAAAAARARWSWRTSSAVAAGFVLVAGAVTLTRGPSAPGDAQLAQSQLQAPQTAQQQAALAGPIVPASLPVAPEAPALVANGSLIRDARLDRYLAAHKQFAGSSALGVPSGYLRNATAIESAR